ncbi:MAG: hypothetical protein L0338_30560 [Acidobacteria bacterium]|nr:hypothetical protein [Acidobacteriota bacterium]
MSARHTLKEWIQEAWSAGLLFFNSSYLNAVVRLQGQESSFYLVAGKHDENFPFWGTTFDNILLLDARLQQGWTASASSLEGLKLALSATERHAEIEYGGEAYEMGSGRAHARTDEVSLHFSAPTIALEPRHFGLKRYLKTRSRFIPGVCLSSQLMLRSPGGPGWVKLPCGRVSLEALSVFGYLEAGLFSVLTPKFWRAPYDYLGLICDAPDEQALYVSWAVRPFMTEDWLGQATTAIKKRLHDEMTLIVSGQPPRTRTEPGNLFGVDTNCKLLFGDSIPLGDITLERMMVQTRDLRGRRWFGLKERFLHPWLE